jgi:hypothetical protein
MGGQAEKIGRATMRHSTGILLARREFSNVSDILCFTFFFFFLFVVRSMTNENFLGGKSGDIQRASLFCHFLVLFNEITVDMA